MSDVTVLLTGAGAPGASGIIKSLRMADSHDVDIVGVDMNESAYGFALVDSHYTVPAGSDPGYVDRIWEIVEREDVDVVLPLTTAELQPLADEKAAFAAAGVTVMVSDPSVLTIANDKGGLYQYLADAGLAAAPEFYRVSDEASFVEAVEALGYPDRPVCFKRPVASGKRGFRVLDGDLDRLDLLLNEKPDSSVTTLDSALETLREAEEFPELVVMEYLPGEEFSVDVLAMGDEVGPVVPRSRDRTRAGISFAGEVQERQELIDAATDICRDLELEYNVNLQFKYDADGTPKMLEINPRVSGTIVMCVGAGVNFPSLALSYALDEDVPDTDVEWGTTMQRFWQEVFESPDGETFRLQSPQP